MARGLQHKGIVRRNKMLHAAIRLFLENGYEKTTTASIAKEAGMSPSSFFAAFESKEALLLTLVQIMFRQQFENAEQMGQGAKNPLLTYAVETALQMYVTELSGPLRELYVMAYSLPSTSEFIYSGTAKRLQQIFGSWLPDAEEKDFYEMDIASAGIMRAFMAKPCDIYFTMERKLSRFLRCALKLYSVPEDVQGQIIDAVLRMDLKSIAEQMIRDMVLKAEAGADLLNEEA